MFFFHFNKCLVKYFSYGQNCSNNLDCNYKNSGLICSFGICSCSLLSYWFNVTNSCELKKQFMSTCYDTNECESYNGFVCNKSSLNSRISLCL